MYTQTELEPTLVYYTSPAHTAKLMLAFAFLVILIMAISSFGETVSNCIAFFVSQCSGITFLILHHDYNY